MKKRFRAFATVVLCSILGVAIGQTFDLPLGSPFGESFDLPSATNRPANGLLVSVFDKPTPESRRDLLTIQQAAIEVAEKATACTVALQLGGAMGSGVVVSADGLILTAAHVVGDPDKTVKVRFPDGRFAMAKSLGLHTSADAALVQIIDDGDWPFLPLATKEQTAKPGDWCLAVGHPGGFDEGRAPPIRLGRVIDMRSTVMRTDCTIMGGDSGGPLFDMKGRVIGIHSRIAEDLSDNFHIPSTAFHDAWDEMMEGKLYPEPIPSKFLAILDKNDDGKLTRKELTSDLQRRVYDRLMEEFELDEEQDLNIKSIAKHEFKWRHGVRAEIVEIEDVRDFGRYSLTTDLFTRGSDIQALVSRSLEEVDDQKGVANVVRVYEDGRRVALGTVVDSDGFVLTKMSRLDDEDKIECRMPDGTRRTAELVARDEEYDFALLKIDAHNLLAPNWNASPLRPGSWAIVPNVNRIESVGVVGVPPRKIDEVRAMIGIGIASRDVQLDDGSTFEEAIVSSVVPKSGAERAGIEAGDILLSVAGEPVTSLQQVKDILKEYRASDEVDTVVRRGDQELTLNVRLLSANDIFLGMEATWQMTGRLSRRRDGFEKALQIDTVIGPQYCGGPVVDMNGQIIGVTLARASRVASYAISSADLLPILDRMRSQATSITTTKLEKRDDKEIE